MHLDGPRPLDHLIDPPHADVARQVFELLDQVLEMEADLVRMGWDFPNGKTKKMDNKWKKIGWKTIKGGLN